MRFKTDAFIYFLPKSKISTIMKTESNPKDIRLLQIFVGNHLSQALKVVLASRVEQVFDSLGNNFELCVVVEAHGKAIECLLELPEAEHLHIVLVECQTAVLAHFRRVCVLIRRAHLQKDSYSVTHAVRLTPVNGFPSVDDSAV